MPTPAFILTLRHHWIGFLIIIALESTCRLYKIHAFSTIDHNFLFYNSSYYVREIFFFTIFILATYFNRKALWAVVIVIVAEKLARLLHYHFTVDYASQSVIYNNEYWSFFYRLHYHGIGLIAELLSGNHLSSCLFLTGLYSFWIYSCTKALRGYTN